jgi:hypothetical protein
MISTIPDNYALRARIEWDSRETINSRLVHDNLVSGPKAVTSAMLAAHPTRGAEPFFPSTSRRDRNLYVTSTYFPNSTQLPDKTGRQERVRLPGAFNPFTSNLDTDQNPAAIIREVRLSILEDNRFAPGDTDARMNERVFVYHSLPAEDSRAILNMSPVTQVDVWTRQSQPLSRMQRLQEDRDDSPISAPTGSFPSSYGAPWTTWTPARSYNAP